MSPNNIIKTTLCVLSLSSTNAFQILTTPNHRQGTLPILSTRHQIQLNSSNQEESKTDESPPELILGSKLSESLQSIGSEAGYLSAAKKRAEEGKAKLMEQIRREEEEAEAYRRARAEGGDVYNSGPADMSEWRGFANDGFEESDGFADGFGEFKKKDDEEDVKGEEEEPKLFLFGDDDGSGSGLIV